MSTRIQVVLDENERELFRQQAKKDGMSLSAWMKKAAREKSEGKGREEKIDSAEELDAFFSACDVQEKGMEPDWNDHRKVIEKSISAGKAES